MVSHGGASDLHILFFPFMMQGHMLPLVDMAKLFAAHGAAVTILTTPANADIIRPTIPCSVQLHIIPFPSAQFGLPQGCENRSSILSEDLRVKFIQAISSLRHPFDEVLTVLRPHCVVTDMFMPWTHQIAAAKGIPRIIFHGTNYFSLCASQAFNRCRHNLDAGKPLIELPGLPHRIQMLKTQIIDFEKLAGTPMEFMAELLREVKEVEPKSYGAVMNSFYELEPDYVQWHQEETTTKTWHVGPVSLCNKAAAEKSARGGGGGQQMQGNAGECLKWLDGKPAGSVVYACFGSGSLFTAAQLREMALGLEASGQAFVWVVRNAGDEWVPDQGYYERIEGRGMVVRGWAPQLLILNHAAVGGFVTHCGWNSSLEGICAGLPLVTWPLYAEQFYNERFLVEVLKIGVAVGSEVFSFTQEGRPVVEAAKLEVAVRRVMGDDEEAGERRRRARETAKMARTAVEEGGSSYMEIDRLIRELIEECARKES
ncbi:UDP-glucose flavonoid 3-O-glucosyltransferase 7 [Platanthera zijinensis]|uniref:Glycosyltransferase n=1 Tax=Platanthera zijinensis TaxID=2320716 RepID=A0AAP0BRZ0_9ASPA